MLEFMLEMFKWDDVWRFVNVIDCKMYIFDGDLIGC